MVKSKKYPLSFTGFLSFPRKRESILSLRAPKGRSNLAFKLTSSFLICAFLLTDIVYANPDTLAILAGNPQTYRLMQAKMMDRGAAFVAPVAGIAVEVRDDNGHFEITIKGCDAFAVNYHDRIYIDFEKTALFLEEHYPRIVTRLRAASRKPVELVHCHEIFHSMIDRISFYRRLELKTEVEDDLANIFAMKALGVKLNIREEKLLAALAEKIERIKKDADSTGRENIAGAFLAQLELPYSTTELLKTGKPDFFYNLERNLNIDLSEIYRATITGINDAIWTFDSGKTIDVGPEARVRIVVGDTQKGAPGFVWAGVKDNLGKWSKCRKIPLTEDSVGRHEAILPEDVNAFTFFWTGGEDVRSGRSQGHWEGQDFYINRYPAGTPLVQQNVTKNFSKEQTIAGIFDRLAEHIVAPDIDGNAKYMSRGPSAKTADVVAQNDADPKDHLNYSLYSMLPADKKTDKLYRIIRDFHDEFSYKVPRTFTGLKEKFDRIWSGNNGEDENRDAVIAFLDGNPIAILGFGMRVSDKIAWDEGAFVNKNGRAKGMLSYRIIYSSLDLILGMSREKGIEKFSVGNSALPESGPVKKTRAAQILNEKIIKRYGKAVEGVVRTPSGKISRYCINLKKQFAKPPAASGVAVEREEIASALPTASPLPTEDGQAREDLERLA